jgi:hypothetical protein
MVVPSIPVTLEFESPCDFVSIYLAAKMCIHRFFSLSKKVGTGSSIALIKSVKG